MDEINRVTAVTPGALTAMALLSEDHRSVKESEVVEICRRLLTVLQSMDARVSSTMLGGGGDIRYGSIRESLQMFVEAQLLDASEDSSDGGPASEPTYSIVESKRLQLDTSKNIIVHFFVERGLIAASFDRDEEGNSLPTEISTVRQRVRYISRVFKHEFRFRADAPFEEIFDSMVAALVQEGQLSRQGEELAPGEGQAGWSGDKWLRIYRAILVAFFEGYVVAAKSLEKLLSGPRSEKDLIKAGLALGHALYLAEEVSRREAVSKPVLENAYHSLAELGYFRSRSGKLEVQEAYKSRDALDELSSTLKGYLTGRHVHHQ
jgi:glycerol-3-phosphate O-acyltransferase